MGKKLEERERKVISLSHPLRTTQDRKSKPTIQVSCETKSGPVQRPYLGDAHVYIYVYF